MNKPKAYLSKRKAWWMNGNYWIAYDEDNNIIAWSSTKKDCERKCKENNYILK